jgi:hypothetical protein
MKTRIVFLATLSFTIFFAHGGSVSVDASKNAKAVAPLEPLTSWCGTILAGGVKGNSDFIEGSLFLVQPLLNTIGTGNTMEGNVLFVEPYGTWGENGELGASLGLGFRHLFSDQSVSDARSNTMTGLLTEGFYIGGDVFLDYARSQADNDFWQIGVGLEAGTRYLTVRANYYIPLSDDQTIRRRTETDVTHSKHTSTNTIAGPTAVVNGQVVQNFTKITTTRTRTTTTTRTFELFEEPLEGFDVELALLVPGLDRYCDVQLIGGYFNYEAERSRKDIEGWRAGMEIRPVPAVVLYATWFEDERLYQDEWIAGVRLEIPLGENWMDAFTPRRRHLAERLFEPVHRKNNSITTSGTQEEQTNSTTTTTTSSSTSQSNTQVKGPPPPPPSEGEGGPSECT